MEHERLKLIDTIGELYPSDSQYSGTAAKGKELMLEAMEETFFDWRQDLPLNTLRKYAELCQAEDNKYR